MFRSARIALIIGFISTLFSHAPLAQTPQAGSSFPSAFSGTWRSAPFELALAGDFERSVYGANAEAVRMTELAIQPSGDGRLTVRHSVRRAGGQTVPGTRHTEDVTFRLTTTERSIGGRQCAPATILKAERRGLDTPGDTFTLDGAKVTVCEVVGQAGQIEVRFDTPEGTGSFWETVRRVASRSRSASG